MDGTKSAWTVVRPSRRNEGAGTTRDCPLDVLKGGEDAEDGGANGCRLELLGVGGGL